MMPYIGSISPINITSKKRGKQPNINDAYNTYQMNAKFDLKRALQLVSNLVKIILLMK